MATKKGRKNKMNWQLTFNLYSSKKNDQRAKPQFLPQTKTSCLLFLNGHKKALFCCCFKVHPLLYFSYNHSFQQQQDMYFCPACSNLLLVQSDGTQRLYCQTCPYIYPIVKTVRTSSRLAVSSFSRSCGADCALSWRLSFPFL